MEPHFYSQAQERNLKLSFGSCTIPDLEKFLLLAIYGHRKSSPPPLPK